jgi:hypothetical protein
MSYEERGQWVYLIANVLGFGAYATFILGRAGSLPLANDVYVPALLWTIGIAIALSIAGRIGVEIAARIAGEMSGEIVSDSDAYTADVRDRDIGRLGEYVGGIVLGVGMLVPFGLALAESESFWIANAMYLAFVLSGFTSSVVKVIAYRRGL